MGGVRRADNRGDSHCPASFPNWPGRRRAHGRRRSHTQLHRVVGNCTGRGRAWDAGKPDGRFRSVLPCGGDLASTVAACDYTNRVGHSSNADSRDGNSNRPGTIQGRTSRRIVIRRTLRGNGNAPCIYRTGDARSTSPPPVVDANRIRDRLRYRCFAGGCTTWSGCTRHSGSVSRKSVSPAWT